MLPALSTNQSSLAVLIGKVDLGPVFYASPRDNGPNLRPVLRSCRTSIHGLASQASIQCAYLDGISRIAVAPPESSPMHHKACLFVPQASSLFPRSPNTLSM